MARACSALPDNPQGADVCSHWRHRRGPTTSLPEQLGGARNWDYRYCWLRDATLTLLALIYAGYREEARNWSEWLRRSIAGSPSQVQTLYGLAGERHLSEWIVPWLNGYQGAKPVRIGNAAHGQLQIDVFGEVVDALYESTRGGSSPYRETWELQREIVEYLTTIWDQPDESIWEVRGGAQQFTFSKVMAWVALDRGVKVAEERGFHDESIAGEFCVIRSMKRSAAKDMTARRKASFRASVALFLTPAL